MDENDETAGIPTPSDSTSDLENILEEKARLEALLDREFTKFVTVMFTDMKGSTALTETKGDMAVRLLIKKHNEIIFPAFKNNNGTLVKTMGDGTMSYFMTAQDALKAGLEIQSRIAEFNKKGEYNLPLQVRVGLHSGKGIVEDNDIYGDVVNVASRFEQIGVVGNVLFSEETYNSLEDKKFVYMRHVRITRLKGKSEPVKVYKAFWDAEEIEKDKVDPHVIDETIGTSDADAKIENPPTLSVQVEEGSLRDVTMSGNEIILGRSKHCHLQIDKPYVSRKHARIFLDGGEYYVLDLQSSGGTFLNGVKISKKQALKHNDEIVIDKVKIIFKHPQENDFDDDDDAGATMVMKAFVDDAGSAMGMDTSSFGGYKLLVFHGKSNVKEYLITEAGLKLGRKADNDIVLEEGVISRRHARVWCEKGKIFIEDVGSSLGTSLNSNSIPKKEKVELKKHDEIAIGSYKIGVADVSMKTDKKTAKEKTDSGSFKLFKMFGKK